MIKNKVLTGLALIAALTGVGCDRQKEQVFLLPGKPISVSTCVNDNYGSLVTVVTYGEKTYTAYAQDSRAWGIANLTLNFTKAEAWIKANIAQGEPLNVRGTFDEKHNFKIDEIKYQGDSVEF